MTPPLYFDGLLIGGFIILAARLMRRRASRPAFPVAGKVLLALAVLIVAMGWRPVEPGMQIVRLAATVSMVTFLLHVWPALQWRNK